ncbi:hypothetical protein GCM10010439_10710 [Actinocorallia aurantiaca]|uniref:Uncharacterized protein n=1 Tax=Actinocorallia aurantiaca TaxID=46204 RepID=A0ABN3TYQ2_9ACTN
MGGGDPLRHPPRAGAFGLGASGLLHADAGAQRSVAAGEPVLAIRGQGTACRIGQPRSLGQPDPPLR